MNIHLDFEEFLKFLNEEKVDFVIIGRKKASGRPKDLADYDELGGNRK